MRRLLDALYRLDDRALNSWWGLFVSPFAWTNYRLGYAFRHRVSDHRTFDPRHAIYLRGAREGRPLRRTR